MTNISHELNVGPISVVDSDTGVNLTINDDGSINTISANSDVLIDTLLMYMAAVLEKMPRVTGNDQAAVSLEGGSVGTVTTVTTCGTVTTVSQLGTRAAMTMADAQIMQGTSHIYSNIVVA